MKFRMNVRSEQSTPVEWWEDYDRQCDDAEKAAKQIIDNWNRTLRPGEHRRTLLAVEVIDDAIVTDGHRFEKTNAMTVSHAGRRFDRYRCVSCEVTGKRFGLSPEIVYDSKFRAKVYRSCQATRMKSEARP